MPRRGRLMLCLLILAAALCAGCTTKFTCQNFDTIYEGQPKANVAKRLGEPTRVEAGKWIYIHHDPYYRADIHFRQGKVLRKSLTREK